MCVHICIYTTYMHICIYVIMYGIGAQAGQIHGHGCWPAPPQSHVGQHTVKPILHISCVRDLF